jgi:hypothetical protein
MEGRPIWAWELTEGSPRAYLGTEAKAMVGNRVRQMNIRREYFAYIS